MLLVCYRFAAGLLLDCYWFATGGLHKSQPLTAGGPRQLRIASAQLPAPEAPSAPPGLTSQVASSKSLPLQLSAASALSKNHLPSAKSLLQTRSISSRSITSLQQGRSGRLGRRSSRRITSLQQGRSGRLSRRSSRSITSLQQGRSGRLGRKNHIGLPENTPGGGPVCFKKSQHASKQRPPHPPDFNIEVRAASRDIFQNKKNELRELPRQC